MCALIGMSAHRRPSWEVVPHRRSGLYQRPAGRCGSRRPDPPLPTTRRRDPLRVADDQRQRRPSPPMSAWPGTRAGRVTCGRRTDLGSGVTPGSDARAGPGRMRRGRPSRRRVGTAPIRRAGQKCGNQMHRPPDRQPPTLALPNVLTPARRRTPAQTNGGRQPGHKPGRKKIHNTNRSGQQPYAHPPTPDHDPDQAPRKRTGQHGQARTPTRTAR